jgi:uncharacterized membrane protein
MKNLAKYFFQGILILLPISLTIYIVVVVFQLTDSLLGRYFIARGLDIPGLGLLASVALIILVGLLGNWFVSRRILNYIDQILGNLPLVRMIYTVIKETTSFLLGKKDSFAKVVMVSFPGSEDIKILGFITTEELEWAGLNGYVAVYILQSMQWAGFTLLVPKSRLEYLDISPDKALQFIVSAGISGKSKSHQRKQR